MKLSRLVVFACAAALGLASPSAAAGVPRVPAGAAAQAEPVTPPESAAQAGSVAEPGAQGETPAQPVPPAQRAPAATRQQGAAGRGPAPQAQPATPAPPAPADAETPAWRVQPQPLVRVGQSVTVKAGEQAAAVVAIWGDVEIDGRVTEDVVAVMGNLRLGPEAVVDGSVVVVGGNLEAAATSVVRGDLVITGGEQRADAGFGARGDNVVVGTPGLGDGLRSIAPWFTRGLMWGRVIPPGVGWVWWVVAVFLLIYIALTLAFPHAVNVSLDTLSRRPMSAFFVGLLTLLLVGPASVLLTISVVGIVVIPFVWCSLLAGWMVGKAAVMRWIGAGLVKEGDDSSPFVAVRSLLVGFALVTIGYMIPVVGLALWAIVGLLGLGAATSAALATFKRERPAPAAPAPAAPATPAPDGGIPPVVSPGAGAAPQAMAMAAPMAYGAPGPDGGASTGAEIPPSGTPGAAPFAPSANAPGAGVPSGGGAGTVDLRTMPRATFLDRLFAAVLDAMLVAVALKLLPMRVHTDFDHFIFVLLAYHVAFWTWKGTTVGSIICNLRLVRTDGRPLTAADAIVRALSSLLSGFALGLGFFYIALDSNTERQAWHDRIAGTLVVRVPKDWPAF